MYQFYFKEVTIQETYNLVKELGNSLSFGHDGIDACLLKLILPSIEKPLVHLINVSLTESTWANRWKVTRVFPLLKDKDADRMSTSSYRPVSLLPTVSKVVERAAQVQMLKFFDDTGQLNQKIWSTLSEDMRKEDSLVRFKR